MRAIIQAMKGGHFFREENPKTPLSSSNSFSVHEASVLRQSVGANWKDVRQLSEKRRAF
jgi:hypothetical protein